VDRSELERLFGFAAMQLRQIAAQHCERPRAQRGGARRERCAVVDVVQQCVHFAQQPRHAAQPDHLQRTAHLHQCLAGDRERGRFRGIGGKAHQGVGGLVQAVSHLLDDPPERGGVGCHGPAHAGVRRP
jgi:hypothetical protein